MLAAILVAELSDDPDDAGEMAFEGLGRGLQPAGGSEADDEDDDR